MINIDKNINDQFCRYKMQSAIVVEESNKTLIKNLNNIGKDLKRHPVHILKFLACSFGCSVKIIDGENPKYYLTGSFSSDKIQNGIFNFINLFVLCLNCGNPETKFILDNNVLKRKCNSCGNLFEQESHKIVSIFIKDINDDKYVDKNYDKTSPILLQSNILNIDFSNLSYKDLKIKLKQCQDCLPVILCKIEDMLENENREMEIDKYLKELIKLGYEFDDIDEYFSHPRKDKKRHPLIKKKVITFLNNYENTK